MNETERKNAKKWIEVLDTAIAYDKLLARLRGVAEYLEKATPPKGPERPYITWRDGMKHSAEMIRNSFPELEEEK